MFAAVLSGLVIYVSCKGEVVGPLPVFEYVIDNEVEFDLEESGVDTTAIKAEDITVTASSISNQAAEDMASSLSSANTAEAQAALAEISTQVDVAVTATQQAYFQGKTSDQIITAVEGKNSTMVTNINNVRNAIANNATLQEYLPSIDQPTGRVISSNRVGGEIVVVQSPSGANAINAEVTSCLEAYEAWAAEEKAKIDPVYEAVGASITTAYNREKVKLDNKKASMLTAFQTTYNTRISHFVNLWTTTASNVNAAMNAGRISAAVANDILIWNNIIFAINVYFAYDLYQSEIALVNSNYNTAVTNLNKLVADMRATLNAYYQSLMKAISDYVKEKTADCHDQGSHDQGGN